MALRASAFSGGTGGKLVANAMLTIRDQRLYRAEFSTFEDYCRERWYITPQHANRIVRHEQVVANISGVEPIGSKMKEGATREIADLPPEKQVEVVRKATETGQKPTVPSPAASIRTKCGSQSVGYWTGRQ